MRDHVGNRRRTPVGMQRLSPQQALDALGSLSGAAVRAEQLEGLLCRVVAAASGADVAHERLGRGALCFCADGTWLAACSGGRPQRDWLLDLGFETGHTSSSMFG